MTGPSFLLSPELKLPLELQGEAAVLDRLLRESQLPSAAVIRSGDATARTEEAESRAIEDLLLKQLDHQGSNKRTVINWLRIVYAAISHLNNKGAKIHPTRLAVDVQPPKSPFQRDGTADAVRGEAWRGALFAWVRKDLGDELPPTTEHLGAIALSAAVCGGLLDRRNIVSLVRRASERIPVAGRLSYFDFETIHLGVKVEMLQRWHPDTLTEALIARLPAGSDCSISEKALLAAVKSIVFRSTRSAPPRSLATLVRCAASYWLQRASRIDVEIARGSRLTQSLKHPVWLRLHQAEPFPKDASKAPPAAAARTRSDDNDDRWEVCSAELPDDTKAFLPWLDGFLALAKPEGNPSAEALRRRAEAWPAPPDAPWVEAYRTWLVNMLTGPNAAGDRMKPATACTYFRTVVPALIAQLGTENPATLGKDDIEVWYGDLLEPLPPGRQRITMASGLREFHTHLVTHYQAEPISAGDILGPEAELQAVDARLVWPDEVSAARRWLEEQGLRGQHPARMRAISLLLMLIFRCGLRRMEAFKLRLCDVHPADAGDLRILPHAGRRLKSHSSKRNIPLRALLSTEEHDELMSWLQTRRNEENAANNFDGTQYLFSISRLATKGKDGLTAECTADWMHAALRAVTGDEALHLHHLRHSFASWTYLRLRISCFQGLAKHFSNWPETYRWLQESRQLVAALIPGGNPGARSAAYATARLLGHSGPEISFEHYIHMSDLIWFGLTQREMSSVPRPVLIAASGGSKSAGYSKDSPADLVNALRSRRRARYRHHPRVAVTLPGLDSPPPCPGGQGVDYRAQLQRTFAMLHAHDCGETVDQIARSLKATSEQVERTLELAGELAARIRWPAKKSCQTARLCPPRWKGDAERQFGEALIESLGKVAKINLRLLKVGVETHLARFNPVKKDVVFHSLADTGEANEYLRFIQALGSEAGRVQVVLRDVAPAIIEARDWKAHADYAGWLAKLKLPDEHEVIATNSPNKAKPAYQKWIGFRLVPRDEWANHYLVAGVFLLVAIMARS
jgi:integrase